MVEAGKAKPVKYLEIEFPSEPAPVKILQPIEEDHTFLINQNALERILCDPLYANKKVYVIEVAGKFRKGKSFLLNFFLRYLRYVADGSPADEDWLEREPTLQGFSWRGGSERDTNGILFWSKPYLVKNKQGEELVVLLMDTQGAFDQQSTVKDCATIFALSTMISSVQIYNLQSNIYEDDLEHLQLFAEYGKLALEESTGKPFQNTRITGLLHQIEYGFQGGGRLLERRLETNPTLHPEHINRFEIIFENLKGFLMGGGDTPYIGIAELEREHICCRNEAIRNFKNTKKLGGPALALQFLEELEEDITGSFESFVKVNNSKNLFKSMQTPAVLVCFIVVNYSFCSFSDWMSLRRFSRLFLRWLSSHLERGPTPHTAGMFAYAQSVIDIRDLAYGIDSAVAWMWENYLSPSFGTTMAVARQVQSVSSNR
ncbi:Atlastin-1 family protein [Aphelenchoides besseyi]|nr:Atlastin-1 family protein [Aphelenchoides besseyi]